MTTSLRTSSRGIKKAPMPTTAAPSGFLFNAISSLLSSNFDGFGTLFSGKYGKYRAFVLSGIDRPASKDAAIAALNARLDWARDAGCFAPPDGVLHLILGTRLGFNGWRDPSGALQFAPNADAMLPADYYPALVQTAQDYLRNQPAGVVFSPGTIAIDCGKTTTDNLRVGEQRGFLVSSGPGADVIDCVRHDADPPAGWSEPMTVNSSGGPILATPQDLLGGNRPAWVGLTASADYASDLANGRVTFPITPDIIVSSSVDTLPRSAKAGPEPWQMGGSVIAIANTAAFAYSPPLHAMEVVAGEHKDIHIMAADPTSIGPVGIAAVTGMAMGPSGVATGDIGLLGATPIDAVGTRALRGLDTGERTLPEKVTRDEMLKVADAVQHDGATILSNGMGKTEIDKDAAELRTMTRDLPWSFARDEVDAAIADEIARQLDANHVDLSEPTGDVVKGLDGESIDSAVTTAVADFVSDGIGASDAYRAFADKIGADIAAGLITSAIAQPFLDRMRDTASGPGYLSARINNAVAQAQVHNLQQHATEIQARVANAKQEVTDTSGEVAAKRAALENVEKELANDPGNTSLTDEKTRLETEVDALEQKLSAAESDGAAAGDELETNAEDEDAADKEEKSGEELSDERAPDVFRPLDDARFAV